MDNDSSSSSGGSSGGGGGGGVRGVSSASRWFVRLDSPAAKVTVNGRRVAFGPSGSVELRHGDRLVLGDCAVVYAVVLDVGEALVTATYADALKEHFLAADRPTVTAPAQEGDDVTNNDATNKSTITNNNNNNNKEEEEDDNNNPAAAHFEDLRVRVSRDVLQFNAVGKLIDLDFESYIEIT